MTLDIFLALIFLEGVVVAEQCADRTIKGVTGDKVKIHSTTTNNPLQENEGAPAPTAVL